MNLVQEDTCTHLAGVHQGEPLGSKTVVEAVPRQLGQQTSHDSGEQANGGDIRLLARVGALLLDDVSAEVHDERLHQEHTADVDELDLVQAHRGAVQEEVRADCGVGLLSNRHTQS